MANLSYSVSTRVLKNGSLVSPSGWKVVHSADRALVEWEISLLVPVSVSSTDTFSIYRSFGPLTAPGSMQLQSSVGGGALIEDAPPSGWDFYLDSMDLVSKVYGTSSPAGGMLNTGLEKSVYFINSDWLNEIAPDDWELRTDGALYHKSGAGWSTPGRLIWDGLPPSGAEVGTFVCVVGDASHKAAGKYLATAMGCGFYSNCPPINVNTVFVAEASKSVLDIIQNLNRLWNPTVSVTMDSGGTPTISVLDTAGGAQAVTNPSGISLTGAGCEFVNRENTDSRASRPVNHVIVKGPEKRSKNSLILPGKVDSRDPKFKAKRLESLSLSEDRCLTRVEDMVDIWNRKQFSDYRAKWGKHKEGDTSTTTLRAAPAYAICYDYYHVDEKDPSKWVLVRSVREVYSTRHLEVRGGVNFSTEGQTDLTSKMETKHSYAKGYESIGSTETEWHLLKVPAEKAERFVCAKRKIHDQSYIYEGLTKAAAVELTEELIVASKIEPPGEQPYYTGPTRLINANESNYVSTLPNTSQVWFPVTSKAKYTVIDRVTPKVMMQNVNEYDLISSTSKFNTQIIKNPYKKKDSQNITLSGEDRHQYIKEFWQGTGPYNAALVVEHPDIVDDDIAAQVAARAFSRNGTPKIGITVKLSGPLTLKSLPFSVTVPSFAFTATHAAGTAESPELGVESGGTSSVDYLCVQVEEELTMKSLRSGGFDHSLRLHLRNVL